MGQSMPNSPLLFQFIPGSLILTLVIVCFPMAGDSGISLNVL